MNRLLSKLRLLGDFRVKISLAILMYIEYTPVARSIFPKNPSIMLGFERSLFTNKRLTLAAAFENPDRVLDLLEQRQTNQAELNAKADCEQIYERDVAERQPSLALAEILHDLPYRVRDPLIQELGEDFDRFKEVSRELERDPGSFVFRHEWRALGRTLFNHKEAYEHIKNQDKAAEQQRDRSRGHEMSL